MKRVTTFPLIALGCSLLTANTALADQAILIGGGYNINGSQGQIELNVQWVQDVLKKSDIPVTTFFTDGDDKSADVHYLQDLQNIDKPSAIDKLSIELEPVARLFGDKHANMQRFRNHKLSDVQGSTEASSLTDALSNLLSSSPDTPNLIVYNGHGKQSKSSTDKVTMELWGNTQMTASELHGILDESNAPTRFGFTQCYSGGFHRLAYENPSKGLTLSPTMRCGFTAESAYRLAEGCSASVDTDDYRDYTTYFFAALDGYDRNGNLLPIDTDTNKDGHVSLREAHFYTLENAHSTDLSRSTSEDYLMTWEPWYLKWTAEKPALENNEYAKLFRVLADKHSISLEGNVAKHIRKKMKSHADVKHDLQTQRISIQHKLHNLRAELIYEAQSRWPAVANPYTANFTAMASSGEMLAVANWLKELTQMQKMLHFRKMAKLQQQLYQYGSQSQVNDYESLVACEDAPLSFTETTQFSDSGS